MLAISNDAAASRQPGNWVAILEAIRSLKAACSVKATAYALHTYLGSKDYAWPSVATLATDTGLSPRSVQRAVRDLVKAGLVLVESRTRRDGSHTSNIYRFQLSPPPATVSPLEEKPNLKDKNHATPGDVVEKEKRARTKGYSIPLDTFSKVQTSWKHYRLSVANRWIDSSEDTLLAYMSTWAKCCRLKQAGKTDNPAALLVWVLKRKLLSKFPSQQDEQSGQKALRHLRSSGCGFV